MQKLASKSLIKLAITGIQFTKTTMAVTDSFRLLEVKKEVQGVTKPVLLNVPDFKGTGVVSILPGNPPIVRDGKKDIVATRIDDDFPEYEQLFPVKKPLARVSINPKLLGELLLEIAKHESKGTPAVELELHGEFKAVVIKSKNTRALCMPRRD